MERRKTIISGIAQITLVPHALGEFIIGISGEISRCVKVRPGGGFVNNDFFNLMTEFSQNSDTGYLLKQKVFDIKNVNTFKTQSSLKNIFIEDLDMLCLYRYYKAQDEAYQKTKNISCLGSCTIKDRKRPYQFK